MAKNKYEEIVVPKLREIEVWARNGVTDKKIASNLGIAYSTFREYVKKYPALSAALKKSKDLVDNEVENSLLQKALGINKTVSKAIKLKHVDYKDGKRVREYETVALVEEDMYIPPDTTSMIFWLKNRRKESWKDNPTKADIEKMLLELKQKEFERNDY